MIEQVREIIHKNGNRNPVDNAEAFYEEIHGNLSGDGQRAQPHCIAWHTP